jgi:IPT/TIG domain
VIHAIQPRLGLKDGDTKVTIWGEGFLNFDELSVCNFGTESVKAEFINSTRLLCISPKSDVVGAAIPFSVSFNKQ